MGHGMGLGMGHSMDHGMDHGKDHALARLQRSVHVNTAPHLGR